VGPSSPHIAGLDEEYFFDTMKAYQNNERNSTIMNRLARGYSDGEIKSMAKWFSEQKLRTTAQSIDTAKAEKGAELHDKYCEKCHEDKGRDSADAGVLAGQWMPYLEYSLQDYHNGRREMTKKMKKKLDSMVKKEGDQSIEDIIHFYGSQE
jgi:sulfide dehydrogenase cytochrome subunit